MAGRGDRRGPGINPALIVVPLMFAGALAAVIVVNGMTDDPSGKPGVIAAVGVVVVGVIALLVLQGRWMRRVRAADLAASAPAEDPAAHAARAASWDLAGRVQRRGALVALMVVVLVPAGIVLEDPRLLVLAAVPIVLTALWAAFDTLRSGGVLDQGYELADAQLAPLGLRITDRPQIAVIPYATGDLHATTIGPTVLGGEREGREVEVVLSGGRSAVAVRAAVPAFAERDAGDGARLSADGRVVTVTRRRGGREHWQADLELAERVAREGAPPA